MPELPDIVCYLDALAPRVVAQKLDALAVANPFVLRTALPPIDAIVGKRVTSLRSLGKRIVLGFEGDLWLVLHLMIAGRLQWTDIGGKPVRGKQRLVDLDFERGRLTLTEAGTTKRASVHLLAGETALLQMDPGGIDPLTCTLSEFTDRLKSRNATIKRALTDPANFSGIGNAYSDEILHRARLSPLKLTLTLNEEETARLYTATQEVLSTWIQRLRDETGKGFPQKVTAFRPEMAVHGKFGQPCPRCDTPVQRIRYAENETNYCPRCQTDGRLLADRSLSRLLKDSWPDSV